MKHCAAAFTYCMLVGGENKYDSCRFQGDSLFFSETHPTGDRLSVISVTGEECTNWFSKHQAKPLWSLREDCSRFAA